MLTFDEYLLNESRLVRLMQHLDNKDPIVFIKIKPRNPQMF